MNASRIEAKTQFFGAFTSSFDAPSPNATRELYDVHGLQISFEQAGTAPLMATVPEGQSI